MTTDHTTQDELTLRIRVILARYGAEALGGESAEVAARRWLDNGFTDEEEIDEWIRARCFRAADAARLEAAGLTPAQARLRTTAGRTADEDTIASKLAHGDLTLEEARRIINSDFWNT